MKIWYISWPIHVVGSELHRLSNGDVVCARAIVRLVPSVRWNMDLIAALKVTSFDCKSNTQDLIEEDPEPHSHPDPQTPKEGQRAPKRLRIYDADLKTFGYTDGCPRCNFIKRGQTVLAGGTRHDEECRQRLYHEMREAGTEKLKSADLEPTCKHIGGAIINKGEQQTFLTPVAKIK